jgi:hypothetical protein
LLVKKLVSVERECLIIAFCSCPSTLLEYRNQKYLCVVVVQSYVKEVNERFLLHICSVSFGGVTVMTYISSSSSVLHTLMIPGWGSCFRGVFITVLVPPFVVGITQVNDLGGLVLLGSMLFLGLAGISEILNRSMMLEDIRGWWLGQDTCFNQSCCGAIVQRDSVN